MIVFFKQKTAYEMRISDWSSDVCSSDLLLSLPAGRRRLTRGCRADSGETLPGAYSRPGSIAAIQCEKMGPPGRFLGLLAGGSRTAGRRSESGTPNRALDAFLARWMRRSQEGEMVPSSGGRAGIFLGGLMAPLLCRARGLGVTMRHGWVREKR